MVTATRRLSREDWIVAALSALQRGGPDAVAVQPLARELGATKGSLYWHFGSRDDLLIATLQRWEAASTEGVIATVEHQIPQRGQEAARRRLELLFRTVSTAADDNPGELLILAQLDNQHVADFVERVTRRRLDYIAGVFVETGLRPAAARRRALLAYATYLGHAQLHQSVPGVLPTATSARRQLSQEMAALFTQLPTDT